VARPGVIEPRLGRASEPFERAAPERFGAFVVLGLRNRDVAGEILGAVRVILVAFGPLAFGRPLFFGFVAAVGRARHLEKALRFFHALESAIALGAAERAGRFAHRRLGALELFERFAGEGAGAAPPL